MHNLTELFCLVDDLLHTSSLALIPSKKPGPSKRLAPSEILTLLILFHQSPFSHFKAFYTQFALTNLTWGISQPRFLSPLS
jgi:hypothetical protein